MTVRFWQRLLPLAYDASGLAPVGMRPVMAVVIRPLSRSLNVALALRIQPIDATHWLNRSAGVS
jgi:hypothetical protein